MVHTSHRYFQLLFLILWAVPITSLASRVNRDALTAHDARDRSAHVSDPSYAIYVDLTDHRQSTQYRGQVTIDFQLSQVVDHLTLDFRRGQISSLKINANSVAPQYNGFFLTLPAEALRAGKNQVTVDFTQQYSTDGAGLYRFTDPTDQRTYVYSDFEPYDASRFMPMFDQPDLKATFLLTADVPAAWTVVTSVREAKVTQLPNKPSRRWEFPRSARYSTYLFPLHAGPFHVWKDETDKIPHRLMVRQSMKDYVPSDFWFKISKQGMSFFQQYFDYPYPFKKYDQVIVPDFNSGAMENVAAVTFAEKYLRKGKQTQKERERMANVILHEMAHMWFGNLVTMRWWNDLWLNESFATFMASLALVEATEFQDAWLSFTGTKNWAYWEDSLVTRHPIVTPVPDTNQAFANFDGITYGKGAAALKQLSFQVGPEQFRDGVRRYFKTFAWKNTELKDFLSSLSSKSNKNIDTFSKEWLLNTGINKVSPKLTCRNSLIRKLTLEQSTASGDLIHRTHRAVIALLNADQQGSLIVRTTIPVTYNGRRTDIRKAIGKPCPDFIYPNFEDHDYIRVQLDPKSLATANGHLSRIQDPLLRSQVWDTLWNQVRESKLSVRQFSDIAQKHLITETHPLILRSVIRHIFGTDVSGRQSMFYYLAQDLPNEQNMRSKMIQTWESIAWNMMEKASPGSDTQKLWFDAHTRIAESDVALERLISALAGTSSTKRFTLDQNRRWNLVLRITASGHKSADKILQQERLRDQSSDGKRSFLAAQANQPRLQTKEKWFQEVTSANSSYSLAERRTVMKHLFPAQQSGLQKHFTKRFFSSVNRLATKNHEVVLDSLVKTLSPGFCTSMSVEEFDRFLGKAQSTLPAYAKKGLRIARQEDSRCVSIRQLANKM